MSDDKPLTAEDVRRIVREELIDFVRDLEDVVDMHDAPRSDEGPIRWLIRRIRERS